MAEQSWRYFVTYSGVKLPLRLVNELAESDLGHRNTYFRAQFDENGRMTVCDKMAYGEVQMAHRYDYSGPGLDGRAEITLGDEVTLVDFDEAGQVRR